MKEKDVDFWQKQIDASARFMAPKHKLWKRLLQQYRLEFKDLTLPEDKQRKISRFYPITRQIISSVAFFHPRIMIRVEDNDRQFQSEIIERVANSSLRLQNTIQEVRQQIFDALYCGIGWIKMGVNPAGDEDKIPPYIANDSLTNGMMFAQRRSPFDVYPDPLTPPHDFGQARFVFEEMLAPFEFVMEDERFKKSNQRNKIKPLTKEETEEHVLENIQENAGLDEEEAEAARDSRIEGQYVLLREVHDRIHKKMITFAAGVEQPIEEVDHPFLAGQTMFEPDPFTGEDRMVGFTPTEGYLVDSGFPYIPMKFDLSFDSFYGLPMMAYGEATQKAIIESLSRRMDNLKRGARLVVGNHKEKSLNPNIEEEFSTADDGQIIWTNDPNNSFREILTGNILPDQLGAEADMRSYEEQTLNVASTSLGGSQRRITATQASLTASFGELNREWMQNEVARVFEKITYNNLRIMADRRYTPQNFLINVSRGENDPVFEAVTSDMLMARFRVEIETGSMKPLFDQLERDDALALFNYIIQVPEVPRQEALKLLLRAFRVPNIEKFLGDEAHTDAVRASQLENMLMLQGQPLQVTPLENHMVHMRHHQQVFAAPNFTELLPQQQQAVQALVTQHIQLHQQALQQRAQGIQSGPSNVQDAGGGGGGGPMSKVQQATGQVESAVRSSAQTIGQKVNVDANQN